VLPELTAHAGQGGLVSEEGEAIDGGIADTMVVGCKKDV